MHYNYDPNVPVVHRYTPSNDARKPLSLLSSPSCFVFDLSGRQIALVNGSFERMPSGIFISTLKQPGAQQRGEKIAAGK
jgi:hypothetical protein